MKKSLEKMKKLMPILALLGLFALAVTAMPTDLLYPASIDMARAVRLELGDGRCSGFVVQGKDGNAYLWTAAHCTEGRREITAVATLQVGRRLVEIPFKAVVLAGFGKRDVDASVCRLDAPVEAFHLVRFATVSPEIGDEIYHIGWYLGKYLSYARGVVSWLGETEDATDLLAQPGSSGGPVFNKSGQVVGILVAMRGSFYSNKQQIFTPVRVIRKAARAAGLGYAI